MEKEAQKRGIKYETEKAKIHTAVSLGGGGMEGGNKGSDSFVALSGERRFCKKNMNIKIQTLKIKSK